MADSPYIVPVTAGPVSPKYCTRVTTAPCKAVVGIQAKFGVQVMSGCGGATLLN